MLKNIVEKINVDLKKSFKTKWDYIRFIICQVFILLAMFIFKSVFMITLSVLAVLAVYILIEYLIDQKNKADKTDDII